MFKTRTPVIPVNESPAAQGRPTKDETSVTSVRTFTETTTMHGCQSLMQPDYHVIRRLMWVTLMLVSTGLFLNAFIRGISRYCSYPSSTFVDIQPSKRLALPDVTVCNNNAFRKSFFESQSNSIQALFTNPAGSSLDNSVNTTSVFKFYIDALDPLDKFITKCSVYFQSFNCTTHVTPTVYIGGGCYTLSVAQYPIELTSSFAGLTFQILLDESEYLQAYAVGGVGVKLMFHQHGEHPPDNLAVSIQPQTDVYVAIKQTQYNRLGTPYSTDDCRADQHADYKLSSLYSVRGCEMECFYRYFEQYVGCDYTQQIQGLRDCSLLDNAVHAVDAWQYMISDDCDCSRPCNETVYSTDVTTMAHRDTLTSTSTQHVKKISVTVYYPTLDVNIVTQQPSYDFNSFIADVGGQMGFFLGASILTLSEFMEFLILCIIRKLK